MTNPVPPSSDRSDILVVEDNISSLKLLMDILRGDGYQVRPATDGELALRSIQAEAPALILLDVLMPAMDGYEVCRRLKASESTREIPVVFTSAMSGTMDKVRAFRVGAVDYITKPFQSDEVLARVKTHISLRLMQQRLEQQNMELRKVQDELEERVQQRTRALSTSDERFHSVIQAASDAIIVINDEGIVVTWNPGAAAMFGRNREEMLGQDLRPIIPERHWLPHRAAIERLNAGRGIKKGQNLEFEGLRRNGEEFPIELSLAGWRSDDRPFYSSIIRDISERKKADKLIKHLASHDVLTDLPNRAMFMDRLMQALARAHRDQSILAILFVDLDGFKEVNDNYGHMAGDQVLKQVAERLNTCRRETDPAGRIGGDEFIICLTDTPHNAAISRQAGKILRKLAEPYQVADREVAISASMGIATYPDMGTTADMLISRADSAMYDAKNAGRNRFCFAATA